MTTDKMHLAVWRDCEACEGTGRTHRNVEISIPCKGCDGMGKQPTFIPLDELNEQAAIPHVIICIRQWMRAYDATVDELAAELDASGLVPEMPANVDEKPVCLDELVHMVEGGHRLALWLANRADELSRAGPANDLAAIERADKLLEIIRQLAIQGSARMPVIMGQAQVLPDAAMPALDGIFYGPEDLTKASNPETTEAIQARGIRRGVQLAMQWIQCHMRDQRKASGRTSFDMAYRDSIEVLDAMANTRDAAWLDLRIAHMRLVVSSPITGPQQLPPEMPAKLCPHCDNGIQETPSGHMVCPYCMKSRKDRTPGPVDVSTAARHLLDMLRSHYFVGTLKAGKGQLQDAVKALWDALDASPAQVSPDVLQAQDKARLGTLHTVTWALRTELTHYAPEAALERLETWLQEQMDWLVPGFTKASQSDRRPVYGAWARATFQAKGEADA